MDFGTARRLNMSKVAENGMMGDFMLSSEELSRT